MLQSASKGAGPEPAHMQDPLPVAAVATTASATSSMVFPSVGSHPLGHPDRALSHC